MSLEYFENIEKRENFLNRLRLPMLVAAIFFGVFIFSNVEVYDRCTAAEEMYNLSFNGVVKEKVNQSWNHGMHYLIISSDNEDVYFHTSDELRRHKETHKSYIWEILSEGDQIRKKPNEFFIDYKKEGMENWLRSKVVYKLCSD